MGDSITEGTLQKFLKFPGDKVQADEIVALIETDKVTLDVRSTISGEIRELKVSEGESVVVGQEIMSYVPCLVENSLKQRDVVSKAEDLNVSVIVPTMGDSVSEGVIAALSSKPGSHVKKDELIAQIETDKVTIDVRSPDDGLVKYIVQEGETVCAGDVIAQILPSSGLSDVQVRSITNSVEGELRDKAKIEPIRKEGVNEAKWALLDYGDLIVNIFQPEIRKYYDLESFWSNGDGLTFP